MKVGIIGGAGFVGTRLAAVMEDAGKDFHLFDKSLENSNYLDITDPKSFASLPHLDAVINLAAEHRDDVSPKSLYDLVNVEGSRNLCNFCRQRGINTIIFTSSVAVYGFAPEGTDESGEINYFNDYGRTKYLAENVYREWYEEDPENRNLTIIRPTVIFGEGNRGNVFNLLNQIASGRFLMFGNGKNRKSMAYVQNVAEFIQFSTKLSGYNLYNYIDKPDLDMNTLVGTVRATLFKKSGVGLRFPALLGVLAGYGFDVLAFLLRKKLPISSIRVKKFMGTTSFNTSIPKTGFKARVDLLEGLRKTLNYEFIEDNTEKPTFITE
ncbi:NAD-dependent epimerase/dehydratase family protein [Spongiibacter sp. KMU-158]|uniref:NAD-dependent epimerase/dehydratase family protein n=1 Tax=Spongiibacter pelagi TaxID=2760804 RepID=A0A927C3V7_9GAMM|nr:NAD-dependent epimerase/dehydratase family protein [Spongiibacter pelagi]MBD2859281.1 NAD-dependent epimerase/dehydratase family protein [Spongiibacter pelagi]